MYVFFILVYDEIFHLGYHVPDNIVTICAHILIKQAHLYKTHFIYYYIQICHNSWY